MRTTPGEASTRGGAPGDGAGPRELGLCALLILAMLLAWVAVTGAWDAFSRTCWFDECVTLLIAGDPSPLHGLRALLAGVDLNPPVLHLLLRAIGELAGGLSPTLLRSMVFAAVWVALVATYGVLRRAFAPGASSVGVLVVAGHALALHHAFDGRYYGPWLAILAWFCLALPAPDDTPTSARRAGALAALSMLLCTIHYFGIVTWGLVLCADLAASRVQRRRWLRSRLPTLAGPAALALCLPLYREQSNVYSAATWIPPLDWHFAGLELERLALPLAASLCVVGLTAAAWWLRSRELPSAPSIRSQLPLAALALVPVVLAAFSLLVQPSFKARYAIPFVLSGAPLAALLASRLPRSALGLGIAVMLGLGGYAMKQETHQLRMWDQAVSRLTRVLERLPPGAPVYFSEIQDIYPVCFGRGGCRRSWVLFDHGAKPGRWEANLAVISGEMGQVLHDHYGGPPVRGRDTLARLGSFYYVARRYDPDVLRRAFPRFSATRVQGPVVRLERRRRL